VTVFDAAREGQLQGLEALRDKVAAALDATSDARAIAALSRQMTDVLSQIAAIAGPGGSKKLPAGVTPLDRARGMGLKKAR
jgi:hypothetical protein